MASREYHYNKGFHIFLKATLGSYLIRRFHVKLYNDPIKDLQPPYLIIGNHVGTWDPFFMSMGVPDPIYFVISDNLFRTFWLRQVMRLIGGIPKSKELADSGTIRGILSIIKKSGVVGLYPEGARNWDLKNIPVHYPTAKLIKSLKIPVVNALLEGSGLSKPRWSRSSRFGYINLKYSILFTPEDIQKMSADEIYQGIIDGIHLNEYEWQEKNMVPYKGKNLAEYLDMFLVVCPRCKALCSMRSHKDTLTCTQCGYSVDYDEYGFLSTEAEPFFHNPQAWSEWQTTWLYDLFSQSDYTENRKPLFSDTDAKLSTGKRKGNLRRCKYMGRLELYYDKIAFTPRKGEPYLFPMDKVSGANIQNNNKLEFYCENTLYRFKFTTQHKSVYKYELAVNMILKKRKVLSEIPS